MYSFLLTKPNPESLNFFFLDYDMWTCLQVIYQTKLQHFYAAQQLSCYIEMLRITEICLAIVEIVKKSTLSSQQLYFSNIYKRNRK